MNDNTKNCVIIVGAGLAGLTAAHTVIEAGGYAVLLEKSSSIFPSTSNSSFSSSGINGCSSSIQRTHKVEDSLELFLEDITKTGTKKSQLLEIVCSESGNSVDWLVSTFGLSLTLSRSGGHGCARTHKTSDRATGYTTVSIMAKKAMEIAAAEPGKLTGGLGRRACGRFSPAPGPGVAGRGGGRGGGRAERNVAGRRDGGGAVVSR